MDTTMPQAPVEGLSKPIDAVDPTAASGRRYDLLRSFALLSFLVVFTIGAISATFISRYLSENLLERDAVVSQAFLQSLTEVEGGPEVFRGSSPGPKSHNDEQTYDLPELVNHIATMPGVVRANLYSPERRILWSTTSELIGRTFGENHELDEALEGELVAELKDVKEENKAEYAQFGRHVSQVVENYLPIWDTSNHSVAAVVEIYKAPLTLFATIEAARQLVWLGTVVAGLFLYTTLFWIVYRANSLIHRQQEQLVEVETMAAVGEMASAVAHSIRNPLAAIRSSAELALETTTDRVAKETSEDIIAEADRLEQWVRELLIFSRQGARKYRPTQLSNVLNECLVGFGRRMERQKVVLHASVASNLPQIEGDGGLLAQMFNSLLANAVEAMPEGGKLHISAALVASRSAIEITIRDSGYGIAPERLAKIFEMRSTTKRGGLGIGMSLVKRIVERHGGEISLLSEVGKGTIVRLVFPLEVSS